MDKVRKRKKEFMLVIKLINCKYTLRKPNYAV